MLRELYSTFLWTCARALRAMARLTLRIGHGVHHRADAASRWARVADGEDGIDLAIAEATRRAQFAEQLREASETRPAYLVMQARRRISRLDAVQALYRAHEERGQSWQGPTDA